MKAFHIFILDYFVIFCVTVVSLNSYKLFIPYYTCVQLLVKYFSYFCTELIEKRTLSVNLSLTLFPFTWGRSGAYCLSVHIHIPNS